LSGGSVGDLVISWDSTAGQTYNVETNDDLTAQNWGIYDTIIADGGSVTITSSTDHVQLFYKVTAE